MSLVIRVCYQHPQLEISSTCLALRTRPQFLQYSIRKSCGIGSLTLWSPINCPFLFVAICTFKRKAMRCAAKFSNWFTHHIPCIRRGIAEQNMHSLRATYNKCKQTEENMDGTLIFTTSGTIHSLLTGTHYLNAYSRCLNQLIFTVFRNIFCLSDYFKFAIQTTARS